MNKAAAAKVAASLVARKLMREVRVKPGMPIWRVDEGGRNVGLVILRAGRDAIGVEDVSHQAPVPISAKSRAPDPSDLERPTSNGAPRASSKQALVVAMMSKEPGATIDALIAATGWLAHTTRAALTGLRKRGFAIELVRAKGQPSVYRIPSLPARPESDEPAAA